MNKMLSNSGTDITNMAEYIKKTHKKDNTNSHMNMWEQQFKIKKINK